MQARPTVLYRGTTVPLGAKNDSQNFQKVVRKVPSEQEQEQSQ
jgi:hypothetical protein